jgi:hypothetical protein
MQRLKLFGLTIMAVFMLGAIAANSAFALENPEILPAPEAKAPATFVSKGGTGQLTSKNNAISCKENSSTASFTSNPGVTTTTITFTGCESEGVKCSSLGVATKGLILFLAEVKLVTVLLSGTLFPGLLIVLPTTLIHIECGGIILLLVGGSVLAQIDGLTSGTKFKAKEAKKLLFHVEAEKQKQSLKTCDTPTALCSGKTFELYSEVGKGKEEGGESQEDTIELTSPAEAAIDF